jgi:hypothetical protein
MQKSECDENAELEVVTEEEPLGPLHMLSPTYFTISCLIMHPDDQIKLKALYDNHLLPDYSSNFFQHNTHKLLQLNVCDQNKAMIPPWKCYSQLRHGTLVLIDMTLHCFIFGGNQKVRLSYYLYTQS